MRSITAALAAASFAFAAPALANSIDMPSGTYTVDPTHASIVWKVSHLGFSTYTGMFDRSAIDATVELDAENVANSSLNVTLNGQAVETLHPIDLDPRNVDFNEEIESDMFLNTAQQPEITFVTTGIEVTGENTANVTGDLTIGDTTQPLTLETTLNQAADHPMSGTPTLGITATGVIDRTAYGINRLAGPIGAEVTVEIQAEFVHEG